MSRNNRVSIPQLIGLRIKELRKKTELSQEALALKAELDRTYINSVENGRRNLSIISLAKISQALGVSLQDFFKSDFLNQKYELNQ